MSDNESETDSSRVEDSADGDLEEEITGDERNKIRDKLSTMSFEDLQKLKQNMGSKVYNKTVLGVDSKKKTTFKRANKNRPREVSSKKKIKIENSVVTYKKQVPRDPRFDPLCGLYDNKTFKSNYKFVNELRKKEQKQLETELQQTKNPEQKKKINYVMQRLKNQIREQEKKEKEDQRVLDEKRDFKEKLKRGEQPDFKKKSLKRLEGLIDKYEELKKTNKLQKHIEKRSKKLSGKDMKKLRKQKLIS